MWGEVRIVKSMNGVTCNLNGKEYTRSGSGWIHHITLHKTLWKIVTCVLINTMNSIRDYSVLFY